MAEQFHLKSIQKLPQDLLLAVYEASLTEPRHGIAEIARMASGILEHQDVYAKLGVHQIVHEAASVAVQLSRMGVSLQGCRHEHGSEPKDEREEAFKEIFEALRKIRQVGDTYGANQASARRISDESHGSAILRQRTRMLDTFEGLQLSLKTVPYHGQYRAVHVDVTQLTQSPPRLTEAPKLVHDIQGDKHDDNDYMLGLGIQRRDGLSLHKAHSNTTEYEPEVYVNQSTSTGNRAGALNRQGSSRPGKIGDSPARTPDITIPAHDTQTEESTAERELDRMKHELAQIRREVKAQGQRLEQLKAKESCGQGLGVAAQAIQVGGLSFFNGANNMTINGINIVAQTVASPMRQRTW